MPRFLIEARYEASDHGAEPDFSDEVEATHHEAAVEEVYARFEGHIFVVSGILEWHELSGTWVDIDDPLYADPSPRKRQGQVSEMLAVLPFGRRP